MHIVDISSVSEVLMVSHPTSLKSLNITLNDANEVKSLNWPKLLHFASLLCCCWCCNFIKIPISFIYRTLPVTFTFVKLGQILDWSFQSCLESIHCLSEPKSPNEFGFQTLSSRMKKMLTFTRQRLQTHSWESRTMERSLEAWGQYLPFVHNFILEQYNNKLPFLGNQTRTWTRIEATLFSCLVHLICLGNYFRGDC